MGTEVLSLVRTSLLVSLLVLVLAALQDAVTARQTPAPPAPPAETLVRCHP